MEGELAKPSFPFMIFLCLTRCVEETSASTFKVEAEHKPDECIRRRLKALWWLDGMELDGMAKII